MIFSKKKRKDFPHVITRNRPLALNLDINGNMSEKLFFKKRTYSSHVITRYRPSPLKVHMFGYKAKTIKKMMFHMCSQNIVLWRVKMILSDVKLFLTEI